MSTEIPAHVMAKADEDATWSASPAERLARRWRERNRLQRVNEPGGLIVAAILASVTLVIASSSVNAAMAQAQGFGSFGDRIIYAIEWVNPPLLAVALLIGAAALWYLCRPASGRARRVLGAWALCLAIVVAGGAVAVAVDVIVQGNNIPFSAGNFAATTLVCLADLVPAGVAAACAIAAIRQAAEDGEAQGTEGT